LLILKKKDAKSAEGQCTAHTNAEIAITNSPLTKTLQNADRMKPMSSITRAVLLRKNAGIADRSKPLPWEKNISAEFFAEIFAGFPLDFFCLSVILYDIVLNICRILNA
jgi:hypothetical protein